MKTIKIIVMAALCLFSKISNGNPDVGGTDTTDNAKVIFFRPFNYFGCAIGYDIHSGDSLLTRIRTTAFHVAKFQPGKHRLWATTERAIYLNLDLKPGQTYYVKCGIGWGILIGRPKFKILNDEQIAKYTQKRFLRKRLSSVS